MAAGAVQNAQDFKTSAPLLLASFGGQLWKLQWLLIVSVFTHSAGCIPVFVGPPFAAMPFHEDLDYSAFSLIIHLTEQAYITKASVKPRVRSSPSKCLLAAPTSAFLCA